MTLETIIDKSSVFQEFFASLKKSYILARRLGTRLSSYEVLCTNYAQSYARMHEFYMTCISITWLSQKRAMLRSYCSIFEFCHYYNMNDNPKNNILMSENIGQEKKTNIFEIFRCIYFSSRGIFLEYFDAYICICHYYIFHS